MSTGANVNVPTNYKLKEQDVNAKLQLYGIYQAFANGKVPSNKQIDVAMNSALASKALSSPSKKLSTEGQKLVNDLKLAIEEAKILLLTKNQGNLLQDFIWQTQQISGGDAKLPNAPLDKDTAKQHGNQALDGLRTLGTLVISNGQFRKLLSDATVLLRDIAGDAAQKAATKVNPSDDQLAQIDRPAEDNTWHDVPDLSKDNLKQQWNQNKPFSKSDVQDAVGDASQSAHPSGSRDPADAADLAARDQQQGTSSGLDAEQGLRAGASKLKDTAQANIDDETQDKVKDRTREYRDRSKDYAKDKFSQERRDQTVWRLKKMLVEIQGHQDYQSAIETLLSLAEEYTGHSKNLVGQTTGTVKGAHTDDGLQRAETDLKTLLERFANSTSTDDIIDSINQIYRDADRDPELKGWFKKVDAYIRKCLQEQGFVLKDQSNEEWNRLYDQGNFLVRDKYRSHFDRISDEFQFFFKQFNEDPQNKQFGNTMQKLFNDLGQDENGQTTFKPHLLKDISEVILPGIFESIRYVPIPRIEYSDPMIDAVVENLVLEGDNLAPNVMEFGSDNYWRWGRKSISNKNKNNVMISVSGVQCDLRDVAYYVKKKQGFPSVTDKGVMDIILSGTGLSFKIALETADKTDQHHFFKVKTVDVNVKGMNIVVKQSNHKLLFKLFKPILLKVMTPVIQKVVEKQVRDNIRQLDGFAYEIYKEAQRAQAEAQRNPDPENLQNMYQRYFNAAQQRYMAGKQKSKEAASDKQVNIAMTQHESLFPNIKLPGGISTKATEYKNLAAQGDKWESPVFSIGSSKETSSFPKLADVTRKGRSGGVGGNTDSKIGSQGSRTTGYDGAGYGSTGSGLTGSTAASGIGGTGAATTGNNQGFTSEVDRAFDGSDELTQNGSKHTILGANNPVLQGRV